MAQQPRGRPPSQAPPPAGRGRGALTFLGGGVLVLAVAGGAFALFGRDEQDPSTAAIGPKVPTSSSPAAVFGPVVPGAAATPKPSATSTRPVAATTAATTSSTPAPTKAAVATKAPTPSPTAAPVPTPTRAPVVTPPVVAPQQGGTVAKKDYTFTVARGDTLWDLTEQALSATGRSTSNATIAAFVGQFYTSNEDVIGSDPDLILPGQVLVWPTGL